MSEPLDVVVLRPDRVVNRKVAIMTVNRLLPPAPGGSGSSGAEVAYNVDGVDYAVEVNVCDTFAIADQVWRLDSVRDEEDFAATVTRVG
ncbi:DUF6406 domain-containing protein [Tenggerimyces flavus]|uniref:DUF6406 domain-containing protein n=1 Tax=Tenggerimyces flavus TaxID=1708749 RepID=A0ABV7YKV1_9ACTN|nr:DUF6406 domain-containing protein [Tenggerimyces flavus]MBM7787292.1 hypothetical protein [Tenggerimyces flavus]